jgi:hypothetical protein
MNKFNIEEVKAMGFKEQIVELEKQIQRVKDSRQQNAINIRHLEEVSENLNQQLETLIELKWNCKFQQRLEEWMGEDVVNPDNKTK